MDVVALGQAKSFAGRMAGADRGGAISFIGDSITAGSMVSYIYQDSFTLATILASGGKLTSVGYYGVSGETTAQMLTRVATALAKRPRFLHILGGTNDTGQGAALSQTDAQIVATVRTGITGLCRVAVAQGAVPVLGTIPPNNSGTQRRRCILLCNIWIRRYAMLNGYPLVDYYTLLAKDGISATPAGNYKTIYENDGIHPNAAGHMAMGQLAAGIITGSVLPSFMYPICTDLVDTTAAVFLAKSPLFNANASQPGVRPDSWAAFSAPFTDTHTVHSLVTDALVPGKMQQIALDTSATQLGGMQMVSVPTVSSGDIMSIGGYLTTDGVISNQVQIVIGGVTRKPVQLGAGQAITRGYYYMEFPAPGSGNVTVNLLTGTPAGSAGTIAYGYPTVINLTAAIGETSALNPN